MLNQAFANIGPGPGPVGLPFAGTEIAHRFDSLYAFLFWLSVFFFILVVGGMIYLAVKYRAGRPGNTKYIVNNHALEAIWTIIPTILLLVIFAWGYYIYDDLVRAPSNAMEVRVIAKQWSWTFQYEDGRTENNLIVPVGKPIKLIMSSEDVLHSFFVPNFRIKQDVVPGMFTSVWFETATPGRHQIFCTEYCGASHSLMLAKIVALEEKQWLSWKRGKAIDIAAIPTIGVGDDHLAMITSSSQPTLSLVEQGKALTEGRLGCVACHSAGSDRKIGPGYKGLFGSTVELQDGRKVVADENYLRESIENPNAKVVKGFPSTMTTYKGQINETDLNAIIAYLKSLK